MKTINELKKYQVTRPTIVDGGGSTYSFDAINENDLRKSAIEDVKELRKKVNDYKTILKCDMSCLGIKEDNDYFRQLMKTVGKIDYIMEKFNLTKEELK